MQDTTIHAVLMIDLGLPRKSKPAMPNTNAQKSNIAPAINSNNVSTGICDICSKLMHKDSAAGELFKKPHR